MNNAARNSLLFGPPLALWALLLAAAARHAAAPTLHAPAVQAVPAGPLALITADARRLRGSRLGALLGGRVGRLVGADLEKTCGTDPFAAAAEVALAIPASPADGEFGVVVAGPLDAVASAGCASRVLAARGGRPVTLREGAFWVVTDVASPSEGLVAVRQGGPLLFGRAPYVRRMMAVSDRREPSVEADARHVALRSEAGDGALVASALLSADLRERLRGELGGLPAPPLAGVVGLGLSLDAADPAPLRLLVGCDSAASCKGAAEALRGLREGEEGESLRSLLGLREPLARAQIESDGPTARLRMALPYALIEAILAP